MTDSWNFVPLDLDNIDSYEAFLEWHIRWYIARLFSISTTSLLITMYTGVLEPVIITLRCPKRCNQSIQQYEEEKVHITILWVFQIIKICTKHIKNLILIQISFVHIWQFDVLETHHIARGSIYYFNNLDSRRPYSSEKNEDKNVYYTTEDITRGFTEKLHQMDKSKPSETKQNATRQSCVLEQHRKTGWKFVHSKTYLSIPTQIEWNCSIVLMLFGAAARQN